MLDTKKREKVVDFVDYLVDGSSILVAADSKLPDLTLDKMCGLTVASIRGSVEQGYLEKQGAQCKADGKPALTANVYQGNRPDAAVADQRPRRCLDGCERPACLFGGGLARQGEAGRLADRRGGRRHRRAQGKRPCRSHAAGAAEADG